MSDADRMTAESAVGLQPAAWEYLVDDDEVDTLYVALPRGRPARRIADLSGAASNHLAPPEPPLERFLEVLTYLLDEAGILPDGEMVALSLKTSAGTPYDLTQQHFMHQPPGAPGPYLVLTVHGGTEVIELSTDAATDDERDTIRDAVRLAAGGLHVVEGVAEGPAQPGIHDF